MIELELIVIKETLPINGFEKIQLELDKRFKARWSDILIKVSKGPSSNLIVQNASKTEKSLINTMLEEMFDEADSWMFTEYA